ncbi:hypothetical protein JST97_25380 [bacterium]|nr:hypothetical protein [bacterium]
MEDWQPGLQLRVLKGNQQGLVIPLRERSYVLGRAISHEDLGPGRIFFHDPTVALVQAVMHWDASRDSYVISHETDRSQSWISGLPLARGSPRPVKSGSRLKFGKLVAVLEPLHPLVVPALPPGALEVEPTLNPWVAPANPTEVPVEPEKTQPPQQPEAGHNGVDRSWFRCKLYDTREGDRLEGPVAEFFPDGQLKRLGTYSRGKLSSTHNQLLLEHGKQVGRVKSDFNECAYSDGMEVVTTHLEDEIDYFEEETSWEAWVRKWIDQICSGQTVSLVNQGNRP